MTEQVSHPLSSNALAEIAAMIGDMTRVQMLMALMDGRAYAAGELATIAGVSPQTASGHLAQMVTAGLVLVEKQGRHRYVRLAGRDVAHAIEALGRLVAAAPSRPFRTGPKSLAMQMARTCYDHLAGRLGVSLANACVAKGYVILGEGAAMVTDEGHRFFCDFGLDLAPHGKGKRPLCRACLDWSERRYHLGGMVGARLFDRLVARGWLVREEGNRVVRVTEAGRRGLEDAFELEKADVPFESSCAV